MEQRIKGTTGLLALIGSPVGHSGSPDMYNFCFRYHNLDYCYMAFDIKEDQVPAALDAMRLFNMRGCNVTMPCKTAAAQNMDELSAAARIIGAVNTIVNENGKLVGHMTDGIGFVENLRDHGVDVKGKKIGVFVGVMYNNYQLLALDQYQKDGETAVNTSFSAIANRVSYFFDFHGESMAIDTMCSSSITALYSAFQSMKCGDIEGAIVGGVNLSLHEISGIK